MNQRMALLEELQSIDIQANHGYVFEILTDMKRSGIGLQELINTPTIHEDDLEFIRECWSLIG